MRSALEGLQGVFKAGADYRRDLVWVEYEKGKITPKRMAAAIRGKVIFPRTRRLLGEIGHLLKRKPSS